MVQAGLMQHLSAIKDYLLLARGDFYQSFLADAARLLADVPRQATANNDLGKGYFIMLSSTGGYRHSC